MPAASLGGDAVKDREPKAPAIIETDTAFLIYKRKDTGQIVLSADLNAPIKADRAPTHDDVYMFLNLLLKNMQVEQTAAAAIQMLVAIQTQAQQAMSSVGGEQGLAEVLKNIRKK